MKLRRLELAGFKSFADTVEVFVDPGVTAVIGPNGCGKSNISDAVRWVLGEHNPRVLRGARMEEVIFQGSSGRRPQNVAEVALHFDNSDRTLDLDFAEVVLGRRVSRSGESEYLINQAPVTRREVLATLAGTGLGTNQAVVIEARMVDALLSDRPDDRRALFEEAAGLGAQRVELDDLRVGAGRVVGEPEAGEHALLEQPPATEWAAAIRLGHRVLPRRPCSG